MARLLLAWELGTGFGHATPLAQLTALLLERGHEIHLVWKDLSVCGELLPRLLGHPRLHLWQAPIWLHGGTGLPEPATYPELLLRAGFGDPDRLLGCALGWQRLFEAIRPDLLLAEHSPTALLVARASPLRVAMIGNGFVIPPAHAPMPSFRDWESIDAASLAASEERVLAGCDRVLAALGKPAMTAMRDLLQADEYFLLGWPELDHHRPMRSDRPLVSWGWPEPPRAGEAAQWPPDWQGGRLFVYLRHDHPGVDAVIAVLRGGPWSSLIHLAGGPSRAGAAARPDGNVTFVDRLIDMSSVLRDADLLISHAGSGTLYAALQAGIPALMLPTHAEQLLLARRVAACGAGVVMWPDEIGARFAGSLAAMLGSPGFAAAARALAARQPVAPAEVLPQIVARCEALSVPGR